MPNSGMLIINNLKIVFFSLLIIFASLFVKQPVEQTEKKVLLGYPIHFYSLDVSGNKGETHLSAAPDTVLSKSKFNILSSWEEYVYIDWWRLLISFLVIFLVIKWVIFVKSKLEVIQR